MEILKHEFNGNLIDFEFENSNVMVNATQMAKHFNKLPKDFLRNDDTKAFIEECLKKENSPFLNVENGSDLVDSRQKSGTWMHRILALKFAAWLNPAFELWVYSTIDYILFNHYKKLEESLKLSAGRKDEIDMLKNKLRSTEEYLELEKLELEEKQAAYARGKYNKDQLDLFRDAN